MSKEKVIPTVETITPEIAREYLKLNVHNRPINKKVVDKYVQSIKSNQWKLNGETIVFSDYGLENGQHRLNAVIKAGMPIDTVVVRGVDHACFPTYDNGKNRTLADVFGLADIPNYATVSSVVSRYLLLNKNMSFMGKNGTNHSGVFFRLQMTKKDVLEEYSNHTDLYQNASTFAKKCYTKLPLFTTTEIGGLYVYLVINKFHNEDDVEEFFNILFDVDNNTNKIVTVLRNKLIKDRISSKSMKPSFKQGLLAKTWNAYIKGRDISTLRYNEETEGKIDFL